MMKKQVSCFTVWADRNQLGFGGLFASEIFVLDSWIKDSLNYWPVFLYHKLQFKIIFSPGRKKNYKNVPVIMLKFFSFQKPYKAQNNHYLQMIYTTTEKNQKELNGMS